MDELHTIVGAGAAEGAVDAANLLKPMLARGELRAVGATTLDEYKKHVEKDAALERPLPADLRRRAVGRGHDRDPARAQGALRGPPRRPITDAALIAAATLSHRYIADRFLPDKAIDLSTRPPRACRSSSPRYRPRSTRSSAASCSSRSSSWR
jgi:ATP-dependent Clp protease ATP-binding subunit ClpB